MRWIKSRQRIGRRRSGQPVQIDAALEVAAVLDEAQRANRGIKEAQQQRDQQLVILQDAVAMGRQLAEAPEVFIQKLQRRGVGIDASRRPRLCLRELHEHSVPQTRPWRKLKFD